MTTWPPCHAGKVFQGTCGWTDPTILQCGRFYPAWVKTSEDRLRHFSTFFPCVECDSSNYAIPSPYKVERWLNCVPRGFAFHFKAFGFFTRKYAPTNTLPRLIRADLPACLQQQSSVKWDEMPVALREKMWELFNDALKPAHAADKLGVVIFQFHLGFGPVLENRQHVLECRQLLNSDYRMAVEFRNRKWVTEAELERTLGWLRKHNIGLVCADELEHELLNLTAPSKASDATGVPIIHELGSPSFSYIRVHRRAGKERLLTVEQIKRLAHIQVNFSAYVYSLFRWGERLRSEKIRRHIEGPIFFMWGTDHEDQPIINSKNLTAELGDCAFNWKLTLQRSTGSLLKFCSQPSNMGRDRSSNEGSQKFDAAVARLPTSEEVDLEKTYDEVARLAESVAVESPAKRVKQDHAQNTAILVTAKNSPTHKRSKRKSPYTQTLKMTSFFSKQT